MAGGRLGFHIELVATLATPLLLLLLLVLLASLLAPFSGRRYGLRTLATWPQIWDLVMWMLLIQYPTISRKTLTLFDCIPFEDTWLLRVDPAVKCDDAQWSVWAAVAVGGVVVFCAGMPLAVVLLAYRFCVRATDSTEKRLVQARPPSGH